MNIFGKKEKLWPIYAVHAIDALAFSVSGIFVPIFLLSEGESIRAVALYFIIHNVVLLFTAVISGLVSQKYGLKKCMMLRYPFLFAFLFMLTNWSDIGNILWLAVFSGIQAGFFWVPMNIFFGRYAETKKLGSSIAKLSIVPSLAGMGGPLFGGIIATVFGLESLFYITFAMSLFSFLPLFLSPNLKEHFKFDPVKGLLYFLKRPKILLADMIDNIGGETEGIIWPIFVFLTVQSTISVGFVGTFIAIGSLLFTVLVGKSSDKYKERDLIRLSIPFLILIWLLRISFQTEFVIYLTTISAGFVLALFTVPYTRLLYKKAKIEKNESFFIMKEVPTILGRLIILTLFFIFADNIVLLFPIAAISYLYFLFI